MLNRLQDVFKSFQRHDVKYPVIGGIASILHGVPRATFDLDILIETSPDNAQRLLKAMLDAGLGAAYLTTGHGRNSPKTPTISHYQGKNRLLAIQMKIET